MKNKKPQSGRECVTQAPRLMIFPRILKYFESRRNSSCPVWWQSVIGDGYVAVTTISSPWASGNCPVLLISKPNSSAHITWPMNFTAQKWGRSCCLPNTAMVSTNPMSCAGSHSGSVSSIHHQAQGFLHPHFPLYPSWSAQQEGTNLGVRDAFSSKYIKDKWLCLLSGT